MNRALRMLRAALTGGRSASGGGGGGGSDPPSAQPVKVVALGDSITATAGADGEYYPGLLEGLLGPGWQVTNAGQSGAQIAGLTSTYTATYHGHGYTWAVCLAGVNDVMKTSSGPRTSAQALSDFTALIDTLLADSMHVVVLLPTPAGGASGDFASDSSKNTEWLALHSGLITLCGTKGVACVDTWATMGDATSPPVMLDAMGGDRIHPGQAGIHELARLARTAFP